MTTEFILLNLYIAVFGAVNGLCYAIILARTCPRLAGRVASALLCLFSTVVLTWFFWCDYPEWGTLAEVVGLFWPSSLLATIGGCLLPVRASARQ